MKTICTGLQPTAMLHIGNYLGAVKPLINLAQDSSHHTICFVADLHAITVYQEPSELRHNVLATAAMLLASGLNPESTSLFAQSAIKEHTELSWFLACTARIGWLNRMTQFKEKAGKNREQASLGLYYYPVLMAADILLYGADLVPVGEDQKQHLEFTRDIVLKINNDYNQELFKLPQPVILPKARVMSLRDGRKKMSKSDPSAFSKILLSDSNDDICAKIMKARTDDGVMPSTFAELEERPEIDNLLNIYALASGKTLESILDQFAACGFIEFKTQLAEVLTEVINPIRIAYFQLMDHKPYLEQVMKKGAAKVQPMATKTIQKVKTTLGLI